MAESFLLWGIHVIVPDKLNAKLLKEFYWDHTRTCKMKAVVRSYGTRQRMKS